MKQLVLTSLFLLGLSFHVRAQETTNGSMSRFSEYFYQNYVHPETAKAQKIEGDLILDLTIDSVGQISNYNITSKVCPKCDSVAISVIERAPAGITGPPNRNYKNFSLFLTFRKMTVLKEE